MTGPVVRASRRSLVRQTGRRGMRRDAGREIIYALRVEGSRKIEGLLFLLDSFVDN